MVNPQTPREHLAVELRARIVRGQVPAGGFLPGIKELARDRGLSVSTVHRAFELLREWGLIEGEKGERPRVRALADSSLVPSIRPAAVESPSTAALPAAELFDLVLLLDGEVVTRFSTLVDPRDGRELALVLRSAVRRRGGDEERLAEYELQLHRPGEDEPMTTFVLPARAGS
ncbi:hypothetical protein BJF78_17300 [Pseudonocardia sp. CNS-139]|nr:hypothetical protein BJF78_17300 [Pseudonocardia sp. CNS-139]